MIPSWFLYIQGFAMVIMGVALVRMRPRPKGASFYTRYVNLGTLWALVCCAVGGAMLAMALGWWSWPPRSLQKPTTSPRPAKLSMRQRAVSPARASGVA